MRFVVTVSLFFMILCGSIFAQYGKISGYVKDSRTGEALIGVNVMVEGTSTGAATDIDGHYNIFIRPGIYQVKATMVGYSPTTITEVRVNIDLTTNINFELNEDVLQTGEIIVVAKQPIIKKDLPSSSVSLNFDEFKNLPVQSIAGVLSLQAGIGTDGSTFRGTSSNTIYVVDGITLTDGRNNTPITSVSMTSVEQLQVITGGFSAEYGNVRSGQVIVATKEGSKDKYTINFIGRYSPATQKRFGHSPQSADAYYMRPFLDDAVCWTGTANGAWDEFTQRQFPQFIGWNAISRQLMTDNDPDNDLTPEGCRQLFLWQHRRDLDIHDPDYNVDLSVGGPFPLISKGLGNLRFHGSYSNSRSMYIIPLSEDSYKNSDYSLRLTSDLTKGMKLMISGKYNVRTGTNSSGSGAPGIFSSASGIAGEISEVSYIDTRLFVPDYWAPTEVNYYNIAAKFTHVLDPSTFYEVFVNSSTSEYSTNPGRMRDTTKKYLFGNNYWVDEAPYGYYWTAASGIDQSMRMGAPLSTSRDSSLIRSFSVKFDYNNQLDKYNNIKAGAEIKYTHNLTNYGRYDKEYYNTNVHQKWVKFPWEASLYAEEKLEFELMVARIGVRVDYSNPNGEWWIYKTYDEAFRPTKAGGRDTLLAKRTLESQFSISPRLGVSFPISAYSKLFFNYGHFRALPTPANLYSIYTDFQGRVQNLSNPEADFQKTVQYELGYEHNLADEYLIKLSGYYKDITNEPVSVTYVGIKSGLSYSIPEPIGYSDTRGFEAEIKKDRGEWIRGFINYNYMVQSSGRFGWRTRYENPTEMENYIRSTEDMFPSTPTPRPVARLNLDFFVPKEIGPQIGGHYILSDIRMNLVAIWQAGSYTSWYGGSTVPFELRNNLRWVDYYNADLRISKDFYFGPFDMQLFVQLSNVFNIKRLSSTGFYNNDDRLDYMRSLHLNPEIFKDFTPTYTNIPGDDKPGVYREYDVQFVPIIGAGNGIYNVASPKLNTIYWDKPSERYFEYDGVDWKEVDSERMNKILKDKAYIDMPNQQYFAFLNPRNVYFGISFNLAL